MTTELLTVADSLLDNRMEPVWAAARKRLDKGGPTRRGRIRPELNSHSRHVLAALLGREPTKTIDLTVLEQALIDRGVGSDLNEALSRLRYSPSLEASKRRAEKARHSEVRETINAQTASWPEPWADQWGKTVRSAGLLSDLDQQDTAHLTCRVRMLLDRLNDNPRVSSRTELAARLYGSSHALDDKEKLFRFVEHALRLRTGRADLSGRELFEHVGIEHCMVSAPVLTWAIPAIRNDPLGEQIHAANQGSIPLHINLYALRQNQVRVPPGTRVLVVENPRLVEAAAQRNLPACVIASNGMPTTAVTTLARHLAQSRAQLWFHADFDQAGFRIGNLWHKKGHHPWMMTHTDYLDAVREAEKDGLDLPVDDDPGSCGETPWDPKLRRTYQNRCLKVHEELLTDRVLAEFANHAP